MSDNFDSFPYSQSLPPSQPAPRSIAKIAEALSKAQGEMVQPEKNKTVTVKSEKGNYSFEYADYNAIVEAVRKPLSNHGIAFTHLIEPQGPGLVLLTRLVHSSGEYLESFYPLPRSLNPKDLGGAITYGKRYCLSAMTGCAADDDADAEPENVTDLKDRPSKRSKPPAGPVDQNPPIGKPGDPQKPLLSAAQLARLFAIADERGWTQDQVKDFMKRRWEIASTKLLDRQMYDELVHTIQAVTYADTLPPANG